ncbi:uncharacterized protein LY79DRAFT_585584 [Colletotrichum navitas]|uniref:Uncharacterized protein n=1 Tax=Colletotrichum navitas TaxID=681940 RepID=A0AAD8PHQ4_9PEZI|nr:uncharacterized protein LY79DRAFT_585584 [Colletotrichum navitas]KAK1561276.1 hypothetical protein LY79DRAFT_585584 [Colletotrichum navitas]
MYPIYLYYIKALKLRLKDFKLAKANIIIKEEEEEDPSKISIIVLSYTITSIDSKSYLGIIEGYNIPFSRVIREIRELNTIEKEKVLKVNTSLFTFLARDLSKPREGPIGNKLVIIY